MVEDELDIQRIVQSMQKLKASVSILMKDDHEQIAKAQSLYL